MCVWKGGGLGDCEMRASQLKLAVGLWVPPRFHSYCPMICKSSLVGSGDPGMPFRSLLGFLGK